MASWTDYNYKEYIIRLYFSQMKGGCYKIFKPDGKNWFNLRERGWNFILPAKCLQKAKDYIDEFPNELQEKFEKRKLIKSGAEIIYNPK